MTIAARPAPGASWREWVATALELAGKARCERFFGRLAYLPLTGDGLWQVRQGVVQLTVTQASGDEVLVGLAGPGMPVGLPLTGLPTHQAQALTDVYAVWLTLADLERSGTLAQALLFPLMRRLRQTEHLLVITAGQRRVQERLRHLLLLLMQEVGQPVEQGVRLEVRLTHQSLANAIGTSRVTCTRLLGRFQDWGWITWGPDRHLVILPAMPRTGDGRIEG